MGKYLVYHGSWTPVEYYTTMLGRYYEDFENIGNASYVLWKKQNK